MQAALDLARRAAERTARALVEGILQGRVPLRRLPRPTQARFARAGGAPVDGCTHYLYFVQSWEGQQRPAASSSSF